VRQQPWEAVDLQRLQHQNWDKFKKKLQEGGKIQPGLTLKGLRHTVGTILAEMGCDNARSLSFSVTPQRRWQNTTPDAPIDRSRRLPSWSISAQS
jgi:hypothetical protein